MMCLDRRHFISEIKNSILDLYHQVTRFLQGYVDNEINLNPDSSCKKTCSDYTNTKNYDCKDDTLCAESHVDQASTKCNGTILNCEFIDGELTACPVSFNSK